MKFNKLSKTDIVDSRSQLKALNPFIDDKGLIREGGRFEHFSLTYAERHPNVLPLKNHVTHLII
jgi:hypothetical protein